MTTELSNLAPDETPRRQLTAEDFIEIITMKDEEKWKEFYGPYEFSKKAIIINDVHIVEEVILNIFIDIPKTLIINNSIFSKSFLIQGSTFQEQFSINNSTFQDLFWTQNSTFQNQFLVENSTFQKIFSIFDSTFQNKFWTQNSTFQGNILINDSTFQGDILINYGTFQGDILINYGTFQGDFIIKGGTFQKQFLTKIVTFQKQFSIQDGTFRDQFIIEGGTFQDQFIIEGGTFQDQLWFRKGMFEGQFRIQDGNFQKLFCIQGGSFQNQFVIQKGLFQNHFWLEECTFQDQFRIQGGSFLNQLLVLGCTFQLELVINNVYIYKLIIKQLIYRILLTINNEARINIFFIDSIIAKESLLRIYTTLFQLRFYNTQNFGTIVLSAVSSITSPYKPENVSFPEEDKERPQTSEFQIIDSDLGKTTLINCDLSAFYLRFQSSRITDVFVTGTKMPRQIVSEDVSQQQLGYSQIKKIYEARGDKIEANRYYAKEMEAYLSTLSWKKDFWEKFNLCANKYSTDYGQSWERGLSTTVIVSLVFYIPYCLLLGFYPTTPNKESLSTFGELASYFLEFLNPIRKADYIAEALGVKVNGWARGLESISRIVIAYCVYQLIQAFRKHGKSS